MSFESPPAPPRPAVEDEVIALRVVSALVDLVVGFALFVLVAATAGTLETGDGFVARLDGGPFLVWMASVLLYSFAAEWLTGGTLGKLLLGLRVVRAEDGGRPRARALVVRTLLRLVDAAPCFYAVGVFVILGTSRRQRIGDLAARTVVVRIRPERDEPRRDVRRGS